MALGGDLWDSHDVVGFGLEAGFGSLLRLFLGTGQLGVGGRSKKRDRLTIINWMKKNTHGLLVKHLEKNTLLIKHQIFTMDLFNLPSLKLTYHSTWKDVSLNLKGKSSTQPLLLRCFCCYFQGGYLGGSSPRTCKWLRSPQLIGHGVRPFGRGPTTRSLGDSQLPW